MYRSRRNPDNGGRLAQRPSRRIAGIRPSATARTAKAVPLSRWRSAVKRPFTWIVASILTAVGAIVAGTLTGLLNQVIDVPAAQDLARLGPDIRIISEVIHDDDQGYTMVLPNRYQPTSHQQDIVSKFLGNELEALTAQLRMAGGADLGKLSIRVLLEGRRNQEIRVVDIYPVNIKREPRFSGTIFHMPPQAGGPNSQMIFDMDERFPRAREFAWKGETIVPGDLFFRKTTISLPDRAQDVLVIRATAKKQSISFDLQVTYFVGGEQRQVVFNDNGKPFQVTATHCDAATHFASYVNAYELGKPYSPTNDSRHLWKCEL
jgi:hypothetical protein